MQFFLQQYSCIRSQDLAYNHFGIHLYSSGFRHHIAHCYLAHTFHFRNKQQPAKYKQIDRRYFTRNQIHFLSYSLSIHLLNLHYHHRIIRCPNEHHFHKEEYNQIPQKHQGRNHSLFRFGSFHHIHRLIEYSDHHIILDRLGQFDHSHKEGNISPHCNSNQVQLNTHHYNHLHFDGFCHHSFLHHQYQ